MKSLDPRQTESLSYPAVIRPRTVDNIKGMKGKLPLKPGELILTKAEEDVLKKSGWKYGDPIPGDIGQFIATNQKEIKNEVYSKKQPQNMPTFKMPKEIDINSLTPEKQEELRKYLEDFKTLAPSIEAVSTDPDAELTPGVQKALQDAGMGFTVSGSQAENLQERINKAEGKVIEDKEENDGLEPETESPKENSKECCKVCCKCNCLSGIEISSEDKENYVIAILGEQSFKKKYKLFNDKMEITFRQPPSWLVEMIISQVMQEVRIGMLEEDNMIRQANLYKMIVSVESIITETSKYTNEEVDENNPPDFPTLLQVKLHSKPFSNESFWNICRTLHDKFSYLVGSLEIKATNSDF